MSGFFGANKTDQDLGPQSRRGGAISVVARGITGVIQVGSGLLLARLLTPEDYGLVAMVIAVVGFAPVLADLGTRDAVVQRDHLTAGEVSAMFWLTAAVGCFFALLTAASGPVIASFYGDPRLTNIALALSVTFIAAALLSQPQALLRRAVRFRELAVIDVVANILSVAGAITMALTGFGYWALVVRPISLTFCVAIGTWACCRWVPSRPTITKGVKDMVKMGLNLSGFVATDYVGRNADRVAIGRGLGTQSVGYYHNAMFVFDNLLEVLVSPLHNVAVSSLSKLRHDLTALRRSWEKALSTVAFYTMPLFGTLAITAQDAIVLLLGEKWAQSGALLSLLALRGIPHAVERTAGWLHVSAGRTDRWFRWGMFSSTAQLGALLCGLPFGLMGVIGAYVISSYVMFIPALAYAGRPLGIGASDVVRSVGVPFVGAVGSTGIGFALRFSLPDDIASITRIAILSAAYAVTYYLLVVVIGRVRIPVAVGLALVSDFLPGRLKPIARYRVDEASS
jgi:PST family polysaccharide transporter